MKRIATLFAFLLATLFSFSAHAADLQAGKEYTVLSQPLSTPKGKIEVIEFFSYGCPHCNDFHPVISAWAAKLPADVTFRRVPVSFGRAAWARLSKIYFAAEASGELAKLDNAVFKALHEERVAFNTDEAVTEWVSKKGLDGKKFGDTMNSFAIAPKVQRADQEATMARIPGVPAVIVDGKYLINNEAAGSYDQLLKNADQLIAKARTERKGK